ncbi:uncharacterized protein [Procambarus clarkii]|uniref:uncharacterized protein n=1 Tax=Procambarus clarkii TaxID=6728 RepID=UPI003743F4BC
MYAHIIEKRREYHTRWQRMSRAKKRRLKEQASQRGKNENSDEVEIQLLNQDPLANVTTNSIDDDHAALSSNSEPNIGCGANEDASSLESQRERDWTWDMIDEHDPISSESESSGDEDDKSLSDVLLVWVNKYGITHNAIDNLLKKLRKQGHADLPKTARSLLNTVKHIPTETKSGMMYIYLGLEEEMLKTLRLYPKSTIRDLAEISLICNIDGLPIFRSKNESLWPVLCAINNVKPIRVFPVVLTYGSSKPSDLDFLNEFIQDLKKIMHYGFKNDDKTLPVKLKGVICDAPAKAMVKAIKLHSGYFGCDRCTQEGVWNGRMTYQQVKNLQLRTDEDFRNQSNSQHHHGRSPFCDLNINMVSTFPIDYMHQICLGVMKRLLLAWIRNKNVKLCARQVDEISQRLIQLTQFVPMHFARKPRSLSEVDRWRATEYRQLLLYTGDSSKKTKPHRYDDRDRKRKYFSVNTT